MTRHLEAVIFDWAGTVVDFGSFAPTQIFVDAFKAAYDFDLSLAEARRFGITTKAFHKANPDKDGSLDKAEFGAAITAQFETANPDKDGTLDWREAQKAGIKNKKVFSTANPDNDGTLDVAEFLAALSAQAR